MFKHVILIAAIVALSSCATQQSSIQHDTTAVYNRAVDDAAVAEQTEINDRLFAINSANQALQWKDGKVLVVSWKSKSSYESNYKNQTHTAPQEKYVTWVTAAPQLQAFCRDFVKNNPHGDLNQRLKQYLGLNPDWHYEVFIELWVDPADVFRPCVDPEIDDASCQLKFAGDKVPAVKNIADYPAFYKNLYFNDFRYRPGVPWTGLGYTYDWGNPASRAGASEYILSPGSPYQIERVVETADYCR
ncbi:MAG: hypothetical protein EBU46_08395 [Nitrosomonadaceae bacterium]|nr:hypothetical protein [Nitrosomonadaceae bacterium]